MFFTDLAPKKCRCGSNGFPFQLGNFARFKSPTSRVEHVVFLPVDAE